MKALKANNHLSQYTLCRIYSNNTACAIFKNLNPLFRTGHLISSFSQTVAMLSFLRFNCSANSCRSLSDSTVTGVARHRAPYPCLQYENTPVNCLCRLAADVAGLRRWKVWDSRNSRSGECVRGGGCRPGQVRRPMLARSRWGPPV